jgi:hypothetical protein
MANHDREYVESNVDVNASVHDEALTRACRRNGDEPSGPMPSDSLRASENLLGSRRTADGVLNWNNGEHLENVGHADTPMSAELERCTGTSASRVTATEPKLAIWPMVPEQRGGQTLNGVDEVARGRK